MLIEPSLFALPDEVLQELARRVHPSQALTLRVVSKRFRKALAGALWTRTLDCNSVTRLFRALGGDRGSRKRARAWLAAQGATITALHLTYDLLKQDSEVARFVRFIALLPRLEVISDMRMTPRSAASAALMRSNVRDVLRACSNLTSLQLLLNYFHQAGLPGQALVAQLPADFPRLVGNISLLTSLDLVIRSDAEAPLVSLEAFVGGVTSLTRLETLRLVMDTGNGVSLLPACVTCLSSLRTLKLLAIGRLVCAPGWAELPNLEALEFDGCWLEGDGDQAFPGMSGLRSLSKLVFMQVGNLTCWPSALWQLSRLRLLRHSVYRNEGMADSWEGPPPRAGLPSTWSQFAHLQDLNLDGQGYLSFPEVTTHLTTLTKLSLQGSSFELVPAGVTALASLCELSLGRRAEDGLGDLDVRALGCLSAFPQLGKLRLSCCTVVLSADFADAAHHAAFGCLEFWGAVAAAGSRAAVLAYALEAKEHGGGFALMGCAGLEEMQGEGQQEADDFEAYLRAGGLLRRDFIWGYEEWWDSQGGADG